VELDTRSQSVSVNGAAVELTSFEYRDPRTPDAACRRVISKSELTERLYQQDYDRDSNVVESAGWPAEKKARIPRTWSNDRNPARPRLSPEPGAPAG